MPEFKLNQRTAQSWQQLQFDVHVAEQRLSVFVAALAMQHDVPDKAPVMPDFVAMVARWEDAPTAIHEAGS